MLIVEIERAIIRHLENNVRRDNLIVYLSSAAYELISDSTERVACKSERQSLLGCDFKVIADMHEMFSVIEKRHVKDWP